MSKDIFEDRRKAFEEEYFRTKETQLVDKLKAVFRKKVDKEAIRKVTGITDEGVLDRLVELELNGELMAAFKLLPLVEVAWADGSVDERELGTIMEAASQCGIASDSAAYKMLQNVLREGPKPDARKAWRMYAEELRKVLAPAELAAFRNDLLGFARRVAETSGGLLGMAFTISSNERKVLDAIERALA